MTAYLQSCRDRYLARVQDAQRKANAAQWTWWSAHHAGEDAEHYRVWKQVVGVDADFVAAGSPTDSDFTLTGLPSGATVKVRVTAVNDAGESQPSVTKQIVVS